MKTALFLSPHLDDVAFSCGGTFARLAAEGWRAVLCTIFTKSVINPTGFALACQLDKGLPNGVDYMKLRRAEDFRAAEILGAATILHLDFAEAPHRGYESAPKLFAGVIADDEIWRAIAEKFSSLNELFQPEIIFAPQGLGNHVDHLQTIRAALDVFPPEKTFWYRDTPYAIRQPDAVQSDLLAAEMTETFGDVEAYLEQKIRACAAYETQINFQFGGAESLKIRLREFHRNEAARLKTDCAAVETFLGKIPFNY